MKKFFKVIGVIALAAVVGAGGYVMGTRAQHSSIVSAIPHMTLSKPSDAPAPSGDMLREEEKTPETPASNIAAKDVRIISKTEGSAAKEGWTELERTQVPNGHGEVALYTSAQKEGGELMWDDSQHWLLEYSDGSGGYYQLVSKYISHGSVYYDVFEAENGEWLINAYTMTGAGTTITQYSLGESGFEEKTVYDSGSVNKITSTIPSYR